MEDYWIILYFVVLAIGIFPLLMNIASKDAVELDEYYDGYKLEYVGVHIFKSNEQAVGEWEQQSHEDQLSYKTMAASAFEEFDKRQRS